jgi:hypothetical protein
VRVGARRAGSGLAGVILAGSLVLAGCGGAAGPSASGSPEVVASASPSASAETPASSTPASSGPAPASSAPAVTVAPGQTTVLDPTLLAVLPPSVAGVLVNQEPASFAEAIRDPSFVANVDRAVFAFVHDGNDLASGVVAHLRAGSWSDKLFEDWRATYDEGACAQASGVLAHAETTSAGRTIYVTTCGGGLRVYHAYVASRGVVVSLFSLGDRLFGEQLMAGLRG